MFSDKTFARPEHFCHNWNWFLVSLAKDFYQPIKKISFKNVMCQQSFSEICRNSDTEEARMPKEAKDQRGAQQELDERTEEKKTHVV